MENSETELDSNSLDTKIHQVCHECGITANVLTCLKKYGMPPLKLAFTLSTFHPGVCDYCHSMSDITETRDFFYPDFSLIKSVSRMLYRK